MTKTARGLDRLTSSSSRFWRGGAAWEVLWRARVRNLSEDLFAGWSLLKHLLPIESDGDGEPVKSLARMKTERRGVQRTNRIRHPHPHPHLISLTSFALLSGFFSNGEDKIFDRHQSSSSQEGERGVIVNAGCDDVCLGVDVRVGIAESRMEKLKDLVFPSKCLIPFLYPKRTRIARSGC